MVDECRRCVGVDEERIETEDLLDEFAGVSPDDVEWDAERAVFIVKTARRCAFVANVGDTLCEKHRFLLEMGKPFQVA